MEVSFLTVVSGSDWGNPLCAKTRWCDLFIYLKKFNFHIAFFAIISTPGSFRVQNRHSRESSYIIVVYV